MTTGNCKIPVLNSDEPYDSWKVKIKLWEKVTNLAEDARAPAVALTLQGAASSAVLKIPTETLCSNDGMKSLIDKLDTLYAEEKDQVTYHVYDRFEKFKRGDNMSMADYLIQFELLYQKAKQYNNVLTEPVLAYRLLKGANLTEEKQALARATCAKWDYETLKQQLKKIFDQSASNKEYNFDEGAVGGVKFSEMQIKSEPVNFANSEMEDNNFFTKGRNNRRVNEQRNYRDQRNYNRNYNDQRDNGNKLNPIVNGARLKCIECKSIYHLIRECPHRRNYNTNNNTFQGNYQRSYMAEGEDEDDTEPVYVQLFTSNMCKNQKVEEEITDCYITSLVGECLGKCILDCGCNCSVAGEEWSNFYIESLEPNEQKKVVETNSKMKFKFGDGKIYKATKEINVPAQLGNKKVMIKYHVVDANLPLLLSKTAMQDARCNIDFTKGREKVTMFGNPVELSFTSSGHYTIPLTPKVQATSTKKAVNVLFNTKGLIEKSPEEKRKLAKIWHQQFGHTSEEKLKKLVKDGGLDDKEYMKAIEEATKGCETCIKYKKPPLRPIVCTSLARMFNEVVTVDIFFHKNIPIIHLCDAATRFSRASVIRSKHRDVVIEAIIVLWISLFGPPQKILTDNGGEFSSHDFREMGAKLNTVVMSTATESPWSNGINERHHSILTHMLNRLLEEHNIELQVALAWSCAAKNALANVYGYSPNQLLYGHNPNFPSALNNELPALETNTNSEIIFNNMKAMATAREAFIKAESSEKLKRALKHKIRTTSAMDYQIGEEVYYKRNNTDRWIGPARIIGIDGKNILIKHQSNVVSVSQCRVTHRAVNEPIANKREWEVEQRREEVQTKKKEESDEDLIEEEEQGRNNGEETDDELPSQEVVNEIVEEIRQKPTKEKKVMKIKLPSIGSEIKYKLIEENIWRTGKVKSKAGKSTGKNKYYLNIENQNECRCIDFEKTVESWEEIENEILYGTILNMEGIKEAQQTEIN